MIRYRDDARRSSKVSTGRCPADLEISSNMTSAVLMKLWGIEA